LPNNGGEGAKTSIFFVSNEQLSCTFNADIVIIYLKTELCSIQEIVFILQSLSFLYDNYSRCIYNIYIYTYSFPSQYYATLHNPTDLTALHIMSYAFYFKKLRLLV